MATKRANTLTAQTVDVLRQIGSRRALNSWLVVHAETAAHARRVTVAIADWQRCGVRRPWNKLRAVAVHRRTIKSALTSLIRRGLRLGLSSWCDATATQKHQQQLLRSGHPQQLLRSVPLKKSECS